MNEHDPDQRPAFLENPVTQHYLILVGRCLAILIIAGVFAFVYWNLTADRRKPDPNLPQADGPVEFESFDEMLELAQPKQLKEESEKLAMQVPDFEAERLEILKKRIQIADRILAVKHSRGQQRFALRSRAESRYRIEHIRLLTGLSTEKTREQLTELAAGYDSYDDEGIKKYAKLSYVLLDLNSILENTAREEQFAILQRTRNSFLDAARGTLDDMKISSILYELSAFYCGVSKNSDRTKLLELFRDKYSETQNADVASLVSAAMNKINAARPAGGGTSEATAASHTAN